MAATNSKNPTGRKLIIAGIVIVVAILFGIKLSATVRHTADTKLKNTSRDVVRRSDVASLAASAEYYRANNAGKLPNKGDLATTKLLAVTQILEADHDGQVYDGAPKPTLDTAVYAIGENCDGQKDPSNYTFKVLLEDGTVDCKGF